MFYNISVNTEVDFSYQRMLSINFLIKLEGSEVVRCQIEESGFFGKRPIPFFNSFVNIRAKSVASIGILSIELECVKPLA